MQFLNEQNRGENSYNKAKELYRMDKYIIDGGRTHAYTDKFRSYVSDCFVEITVTEKNTGLSTSFRVQVAKQ